MYAENGFQSARQQRSLCEYHVYFCAELCREQMRMSGVARRPRGVFKSLSFFSHVDIYISNKNICVETVQRFVHGQKKFRVDSGQRAPVNTQYPDDTVRNAYSNSDKLNAANNHRIALENIVTILRIHAHEWPTVLLL